MKKRSQNTLSSIIENPVQLHLLVGITLLSAGIIVQPQSSAGILTIALGALNITRSLLYFCCDKSTSDINEEYPLATSFQPEIHGERSESDSAVTVSIPTPSSISPPIVGLYNQSYGSMSKTPTEIDAACSQDPSRSLKQA